MTSGADVDIRNQVQLRWENGRTEEFDIYKAWEMFREDSDIWKISWTCPNGKRLRIVRQQVGRQDILIMTYVEDLMETVIGTKDDKDF